MRDSRTENSIHNVFATMLEYFIKIILTFIARTIFIKYLGTEFLGLDGLYTNILSILSITELGLQSAIIFSLYKPILETNTSKIKAIMYIYRKCYFYIGCIIAIIGMGIMPFLPRIVNSDYNFGNLYFIFFLYLLQTLSTYWALAYKESMLIADQKKYKIVALSNLILVLKFIMQVISLIVYKSFEGYVISGIVTTIARNLIVSYIVNKNYPYLKHYNGEKLEKSEKVDLSKNVFGMSLYKISSTVMNSTDNIIISTFVSLSITGIYSNYLLIVSNLKMAINMLFSSITASIGNLCAEGNKNRSEFIFRCVNFLNFWIYGFAAICLYSLLNPFIIVWIGEKYIFSNLIVMLIVLNFATEGLQNAVILYKDACGLFWKGKIRPVLSALLNIVISVILVKLIGIAGVILGSIISRMITTWWFDGYLVYKNAFNMSPKKYYFRYFKSLLIICFTTLIIELICLPIHINGVYLLITKLFLCLIIPNLLFGFIFRNSEEYIYIKSIVINKIRNILNKKSKRE